MFRAVPLSIIRSFFYWTHSIGIRHTSLLTACEQNQDGTGVPSWSCSQAVSKPVWHTPLPCVQWKTSDDGQRNCPKHVEFHSKNKFQKLVHLVGFIIRNLSQFTVTWTSNWSKHVGILVFLILETLRCNTSIVHNFRFFIPCIY